MRHPYELHVTVHPDDEAALRRAVEGDASSVKVLSFTNVGRGYSARDVMTSQAAKFVDLDEAVGHAGALAKMLADSGLRVLRTKVETVPWNIGAVTDDFYHETHMRVVGNLWNVNRFNRYGKGLMWSESWKRETYATLRTRGGWDNHVDRLHVAACHLLTNGIQIVSDAETELVAYDSALGHDRAWEGASR